MVLQGISHPLLLLCILSSMTFLIFINDSVAFLILLMLQMLDSVKSAPYLVITQLQWNPFKCTNLLNEHLVYSTKVVSWLHGAFFLFAAMVICGFMFMLAASNQSVLASVPVKTDLISEGYINN
jgi:hypothetical protein